MSPRDDGRSALIEAHLARVVNRAGARTAAAITRDGRVVLSSGETDYLDTVMLAALAASIFAATRETAALLEEEEFSTIIQQGKKRHLMVSILDREVLLAVVFEDISRLGLIRIEVQQLIKEFAPSLIEMGYDPDGEEEGTEEDVGRFKKYAENLIDQIFRD